MSGNKSSNFNLNLFGGQTKISQKVETTTITDDGELKSGIQEFLEATAILKDQMKLSEDKISGLESELDELQKLVSKSPLDKASAKTLLQRISNIIDSAAGGVLTAGVLSMIQALITALG